MYLDNFSLEKGYISNKWRKAQQRWVQQNLTKRTDTNLWAKNTAKALQSYTYNVTKAKLSVNSVSRSVTLTDLTRLFNFQVRLCKVVC